MHYAVFISGPRTNDAVAALCSVGLGALAQSNDVAPMAVECGDGPGRQAGTLITWPDTLRPGQAIDHWNPETMTALPLSGTALAAGPSGVPPAASAVPLTAYFVFNDKRPPKPSDLLRSHSFEGVPTKLGDGHEWTLPNQFRLPTCFAFDEGRGARGEDRAIVSDSPLTPHPSPLTRVTTRIKATHQPLYDRMQWALAACRSHLSFLKKSLGREVFSESEWAALEHDQPRHIDPAEAFPFLCEMLAVNYRVTPQLCELWELFDPTNYWRALARITDAAAIDDLVAELQKKTVEAAERLSPLALHPSPLDTSDTSIGEPPSSTPALA